MKVVVLPHQGLGDQLIMNGYINYLASNPDIESIVLIARSYQKKTLEHLYQDMQKVSFSWDIIESERTVYTETNNPLMKALNGMTFGQLILVNNEPFIVHVFGFHSSVHAFIIPGRNWADSFYINANVDPTLRYSMFTLPRNMTRSKGLYESLIDYLGGSKYILIHDDPSRQRYINANHVINAMKTNEISHLPVIYLGKNRYSFPLFEGLNNIPLPDFFYTESFLDIYDTIFNATECHFMDSSFACLTDTMNTSKSKLYLHYYITEMNRRGKFIEAHTNRLWTTLYE
jgi:hypothetical protein